jgi:AmmeMemoRadiSam system protein B/AmmeMemoRadiSam system protein A
LAALAASLTGGIIVSAESIRTPAVAGTFYPGDADALRRAIKEYLDAAPTPTITGQTVGIIVPHAGYRYSAAVAAYGFKALAGAKADTVVIIGHNANAQGVVALMSDVQAFETPLGRVPVDTELVAALAKAHSGLLVHNRVHQRDHTVEVQLPFLQTVLPGCRIVPMLFGDAKPEHCRVLAEALAHTAGTRRLLIVASTDLCHYPTQRLANALDKETMAQVEKADVEALFSYLDGAERRHAEESVQTAMCASGGVGTLLAYAKARGVPAVQVLRTATSGDVPAGDSARVVGYAAALVSVTSAATVDAAAAPGQETAVTPEPKGFSLSPEVQKELLALARRRIATAARGDAFEYSPPEALKEDLAQRAPVFVTLHKNGRLRGCIGMTAARGELWCAVRDMAMAAAFEDRRFTPVRTEELASITIEISVLSPLEAVTGAERIVPKQHGVVVRRQGRSGLFLPQVWDQIPDKERFLSVLCAEKAGLAEDAWKDSATQLLVFTVFAFEEH